MGVDVTVRVRSTRKPCPATVRREGEGFLVEIAEGEEGIAPGQACVIYDHAEASARVLGGGTIHRVEIGLLPGVLPLVEVLPRAAV